MAQVPATRYDVCCHLQQTHLLVICLFILPQQSLDTRMNVRNLPSLHELTFTPFPQKNEGIYTVGLRYIIYPHIIIYFVLLPGFSRSTV
jgi:hypothetical protein